MPSTYTPGGIELIGDGEQSGNWGDTTNTNLQILDRMISQAGAITLSGTTHTLTISDGTLSDGQYGILVFGGSPSGTNTVTISPNDAQRSYIVKNDSGESVVLTQGSGGNVTVADGKTALVYCDGAGSGAAVVDLTADLAVTALTLADLGVTASASELNTLDGITATTAELNILDGVTADATELNILDGVTATTAELNILDGVTATTAELNILDGVTATTAELNLLDGITALSGSDTEIVTGTAGTDGQIGKWNADGDLIGVGTNTANGDVVVLEDVSGSPGLPAVDGSQLTGTGGVTTLTTMDLSVSATYSSIPAGANFLRLRIKGLSLSGSDDPFLRIGDAGGVEATGYVSVNHGFGTGVTRQLETTAWQFNTLSADARTVSGVVELFRVGATNEWEMKFHGRDNNDRQLFTSGSKTLSAELTTIAFAASGSDTVDAGSVIVEELS